MRFLLCQSFIDTIINSHFYILFLCDTFLRQSQFMSESCNIDLPLCGKYSACTGVMRKKIEKTLSIIT